MELNKLLGKVQLKQIQDKNCGFFFQDRNFFKIQSFNVEFYAGIKKVALVTESTDCECMTKDK